MSDPWFNVLNGLFGYSSAAVAALYFVAGRWIIGLIWAVTALCWLACIYFTTDSAHMKGAIKAYEEQTEIILKLAAQSTAEINRIRGSN